MVAKLQENQSARALTCRRPDAGLIRTGDDQLLTVADIFATAGQLSERLPDMPFVINCCASRAGFLAGLIAAIQADRTTLMPPNRQPGTLARLKQAVGPFVLIHDQQDFELEDDYPGCRVNPMAAEGASNTVSIPDCEPDRPCIIAYTSGSTGEATAIPKPWFTLWEGAAVNRTELLHGLPDELELLATVPGQHMYGFETAVMLPLAAGIVLHDTQPFYPADIAHALHQMQEPRVLVSTPLHLRALLRSELELPAIARIICATAPLDPQLAADCEQRWDTEVMDTYGCSEAGCIARRRLTHSDHWQLFSAFELTPGEDGSVAVAPHLPEPVPLPDHIEMLDDSHFRLLGRSTDLVNIAGKRASLSDINQALMTIPGVVDGVVFQVTPDADRLSALVVAPGLDARQLAQELKASVDPVMVPRPIVFTDQLPRNATGKLPRQALLDAWQQARAH